MSIADLPTLNGRQSERYATARHQVEKTVLVKEAKRKAKHQNEVTFRREVWARDKGRSRASKTPLSHSGSDFKKVGEVHHVIPRSLAPERVYDVTNGLLLSKHEHALAEAICSNAGYGLAQCIS